MAFFNGQLPDYHDSTRRNEPHISVQAHISAKVQNNLICKFPFPNGILRLSKCGNPSIIRPIFTDSIRLDLG